MPELDWCTQGGLPGQDILEAYLVDRGGRMAVRSAAIIRNELVVRDYECCYMADKLSSSRD